MATSCEVRLGGYEGDEDNDFNCWTQTTKCGHKCFECGKTIPGGIAHERATWYDEDRKQRTVFTCAVCAEIAWAFYDCRLYGHLWDSMDEEFGKVTTGCFTKLRTPAAKAEFQRQWMKWAGLVPQAV
jgi:hypothetical protein